ncbi:MAG: hypothetical protein IJX90_11765 [Blautia sp.]|nr:hypothetical protein [Blautia sp.]
MKMNEKIYKVMDGAGLTSLVLGIVTIIFGVTTGVLLIINAAKILKAKKGILI